MTDTPKPATTLSDEDAEVLADQTWGIYRGEREARLEAMVRKLDAECVALRERLRVAEERVECLHFGPNCRLCGNTEAVAEARAYIARKYPPASDAAPKETT